MDCVKVCFLVKFERIRYVVVTPDHLGLGRGNNDEIEATANI